MRSRIAWRSVLAFVTVEEASLNAFLSVSGGSPYKRQLDEYLASLLQRRYTKPAWCLLGKEAGAPVTRAALWALPDHEVPTDIVLVDSDWNHAEHAAGRLLLSRVHDLAAAHGADALTHHVDSPPGPPQYQEHAEARVRLLTESGYELVRDGLRWNYSGPSAREARRRDSLVFRSLPEVGEEAFVEAIASTYRGTRDSWLTRNHDIGKIRVPESILNKPGPLDPREWAVMRRHTVTGEAILRPIADLRDILPIVRGSHERWDGRGYPDGLAQDVIPLGARVIAVCDAFRAMVEPRPYRPARQRDEARQELVHHAGTQFDRACVDALLDALAKHEAEEQDLPLHRPAAAA